MSFQMGTKLLDINQWLLQNFAGEKYTFNKSLTYLVHAQSFFLNCGHYIHSLNIFIFISYAFQHTKKIVTRLVHQCKFLLRSSTI